MSSPRRRPSKKSPSKQTKPLIDPNFRPKTERLEDRTQPALGIVGSGIQGSSPAGDLSGNFNEAQAEDAAVFVDFTTDNAGAASVTVSYGDGATDSVVVGAPAVAPGINHVVFSHTYNFADDNPTGTPSDLFTASFTVTSPGGNGSTTALGTINNVAPGGLSVTGGGGSGVEGSLGVTLTGTFTDASTQDTFTVSVNWGDGTTSSTAVGAGANPHAYTIAHLYADDNPTGTSADVNSITVTVRDDDTGTTTGTASVTVSNVAPSAVDVTPSPAALNEGATQSLTVTFSDPGVLDTFSATITWGDGQTSTASVGAGGTTHTITASHVYVDDNPTGTSSDAATVSVTVIDDDTGIASGSAGVTVSDVAPTILGASGSPGIALEGGQTTETISFSDPSPTDTYTATVSWSDGVTQSLALGAGTTSFSVVHTYLDDNPTGTSSDLFTYTVSIVDDDTRSAVTAFVLQVNDVAPGGIGIAPAPVAVNEGSPATITVSFTDAGTQDTFTATVSWGDGATESVTVGAGANPHTFSLTHSYADDNPSGTSTDLDTITVSVVDDDTLAASSTAGITVNDVAPTVTGTALSATNIAEGSAVTLTVTFTDPGVLDTFTASISWGDGTPTESVALAAGTTSFTVSHVYADDNPSGTPSDVNSISVTVRDDDTLQGTGGTQLTVNNAAPVVAEIGVSPAVVNEGQTQSVTVTFTDAGVLDTHTVTITWGDGQTTSVAAAAGVTSVSAAHVYADDNPTGTPSDAATVSVVVADDDTGTGSGSAAVTVSDVAPGGIGVAIPLSVNEGATYTFTVTFSDASLTDTFTATVSWSDGSSQSVAVGAGANPHTFSLTHSYADDNPSGTSTDLATVTVSVADDDTLAASVVIGNQTVADVAPGGIGITPSPTAVNEGSPATITISFTDASPTDTFTATMFWGDGETQSVAFGAGANPHTFSLTHSYADDNPTGTSTDPVGITVSVVDDDTLSATGSATITVNDVAPGAIGVTPSLTAVVEGNPVTVTVTFTDASVADTFTASIGWGDGTPTQSFALGGATSFTASHLYADDNPTGTSSDQNTISVTVRDDDTLQGVGSALVTVSDAAPAVIGLTPSSANISEGAAAVTLTVTFTDAGTQDTFTATVSWGDGSPSETVAIGAGANPHSFTVSHLFLDDNPTGTPSDVNTISVTVRDDDTLQGTANVLLTVNNVAPTIPASNVSALSINEGQSLTVTVTISDPGVLDTYTATLTWGDGATETFAFAHTPTTSATFTTSFTHLYADDNPTGTPADLNRIRIQLVDDDTGAAGPLTVDTILVNNIAPRVTGISVSPAVISENDTVTITVTFTDPGAPDTFTATVNWADGSPTQTLALAAGTTSFTASHQYLDDNPSGTPADGVTVSVTVGDDDTGTTIATAGLTVNNVAPTVGVTTTTPVTEGSAATVTVTLSDVGTLDPHTVTIAWGDGTSGTRAVAAGVTSLTAAHVYADDNPTGTPSDPVTITVSVADDDAGTASATAGLTVNNAAPAVGVTATSPVNEGGATTVTVTLSDAGVLDAHTVTIAWGDGVTGSVALAAGVTSLTASHVYADDNLTGTPSDAVVITVTAADDDTGTASATAGVTVNNVAPVVTGLNMIPSFVGEGSATTLTLSLSDAGVLDTHTVSVAWGDGTTGSAALAAGVSTFSAAHTYADDNPTGTPTDLASVSVTVSDDDTGSASQSVGVVVANLAPSGVAVTLSSATVDEGGAVTATVTFTDVGVLDTFTVALNWGDGATTTAALAAGATSFSAAHTYADDGASPGNGTPSDAVAVTATVTDDDTGSAAGSAALTVNNLAPTVGVAATSPVTEGSAATVTVTLSDAGVLDAHSVTIDWADGSTASVALTAGVTSVTASHVYADDNPTGTPSDAVTVTVTVADDDTGTASATAGLTVNNAAPAVGVTVTAAVTEGSAATATVTLSDAGVLDTHTVTIAWGDGSTDSVALAAGVTSVTAAHTYADDDPTGTPSDAVVVTVSVADDDTGTASATAGLTVNNADPAITALIVSPSPVDEGAATTLTVSFSDAGVLDTHIVTIAWGDGATGSVALAAGVTSLTAAHTYADDNPTGTPTDLASISVSIADDDTGSASASVGVVVANVAPVVTGTAVTGTVTEGGVATLTVTFSDAGAADSFTASVAWGDGTTESVALAAGTTSFTATHLYADDGFSPGNGTPSDAVTVSVTVADDDTGSGSSTAGLTVTNADPAFVGAGFSSFVVNEGEPFTLSVSFSDAGVLDGHTATVSWGDGTTESLALAAGATSFSAGHTYLDDDPTGTPADFPTVSVAVADDDTGSFSVSLPALTVLNVAPAVGIAAISLVDEGSATTVTVTLSDAGVLDTHTLTLAWGDGATESASLAAGVTSFTATHTYVDDNPTGTPSDVVTVTVDVADDDTGTASATADVTVNNVAPSITGMNGIPSTVAEGGSVTLTVTFTDPGAADTFTASVAWGDGSSETAAVGAGATSFTASHVYIDDDPTGTPADPVTISVSVADDDTGSTSQTIALVVANENPAVGVLTAGPVTEGDATTVTVTLSDAGLFDTHSVTVAWGDGATESTALPAGVTSFTAAHVYADDGFAPGNGTPADDATIVVTVADDDTGTATGSGTITVLNAAPTAGVAATTPVDEGSATTITVTLSDAGVLDGHTVAISWGDGSTGSIALAAGVTSVTAAHGYADDNPTGTPSDVVTIDVSVTDDDTGTAGASADVTVNNVAPAVGVTAAATVVEGSAATVTVTLSDAGVLDTHSVTIAWGDGSTGSAALAAGVTSFTAAHVYADDNPTGTSADPVTISVAVADDDTGTASGTAGLTVLNDAPAVVGVNGSASSIFEGSALTLTVTLSDAGVLDDHTLTVAWGDGQTQTAALAAGVFSFTATHTYADDNPTGTPADSVAISVSVADDDTGTGSGAFGAVVVNADPTVGVSATQSVNEGGAATVTVTLADAGVADDHTLTLSWGDGATTTAALAAGVTSFTAAHTYVDDNPTGTPSDLLGISVAVTDDDTGSAQAGTSVVVNNVAPVVGGLAVSPTPVNLGATLTLTGAVTDVGAADTQTVVIAWGDGTTSQVSLVPGQITFSATHAYRDDNLFPQRTETFAISATATDDDTGTSAAATTTATVFNPLPGLNLPHTFATGPDAGGGNLVRSFNPDGTPRLAIFPALPADVTGGDRVAEADVNGDGVGDIVVGSGPGTASLVRVFDGKTKAEIFSVRPFEATFTGGVFVAAGDLNRDGKAEIVITPDEGGGPRVRIFDGTGFQIADFFGIEDEAFRGGARAAVGDVNADGTGDLIVAAGFDGGPRVAVWDGTSLNEDRYFRKFFGDFFAFESTVRNGAYVAGGDVNGDGYADLIAGGGPNGGPRVRVFSGKALVQGLANYELVNFFAGNTDNRGGIRVAAKDLNGDPFADLVVGDGRDAGSQVTAYAGAKTANARGELPKLYEFDAYPGFDGGVFVG